MTDIGLRLKKQSGLRYARVVVGLSKWDNEYVFYIKDPGTIENAKDKAIKEMSKLNLIGVYDEWVVKEASLFGFDSNVYFA